VNGGGQVKFVLGFRFLEGFLVELELFLVVSDLGVPLFSFDEAVELVDVFAVFSSWLEFGRFDSNLRMRLVTKRECKGEDEGDNLQRIDNNRYSSSLVCKCIYHFFNEHIS